MQDRHYADFFVHGLKDGQVVHVKDVSNGLECGCICAACETPLIAYNNPSNTKAAHFRHKSKADCVHSYESALHYYAKQLIAKKKSLMVPQVNYYLSGQAEDYKAKNSLDWHATKAGVRTEVEGRLINFDRVIIEQNHANFRPDLKCIKGDRVLLVEIAVSHFVDELKEQKIRVADVPVLEIDLSDEIFYSMEEGMELLERIIFDDEVGKMRWVYNLKVESKIKSFEKLAADIRYFIEQNSRVFKTYGNLQKIYKCPINKEEDFITMSPMCEACRYFCGQSNKMIGEDGVPLKYAETWIECIGHKKDEYNRLVKSQSQLEH